MTRVKHSLPTHLLVAAQIKSEFPDEFFFIGIHFLNWRISDDALNRSLVQLPNKEGKPYFECEVLFLIGLEIVVHRGGGTTARQLRVFLFDGISRGHFRIEHWHPLTTT